MSIFYKLQDKRTNKRAQDAAYSVLIAVGAVRHLRSIFAGAIFAFRRLNYNNNNIYFHLCCLVHCCYLILSLVCRCRHFAWDCISRTVPKKKKSNSQLVFFFDAFRTQFDAQKKKNKANKKWLHDDQHAIAQSSMWFRWKSWAWTAVVRLYSNRFVHYFRWLVIYVLTAFNVIWHPHTRPCMRIVASNELFQSRIKLSWNYLFPFFVSRLLSVVVAYFATFERVIVLISFRTISNFSVSISV